MTSQSELAAWLNGTATGGPNNDGRYPMTYKDGQVHLILSPLANPLATNVYPVPVGPLSWNGLAPDAQFGAPYSYSYNITGGTAPYTRATVAVPSGLSVAIAGALLTISGTPNAAGSNASINVTVTDSAATPASVSVIDAINVAVTVPGQVTNAVATAGDNQATVSFNAPANTGGQAITTYRVTSSPGGITAYAGASPIIVTGLTSGVAYTFTVDAANPQGYGAASAASNSVTPTGVFNPATDIFPAGEPGLWLNPGDLPNYAASVGAETAAIPYTGNAAGWTVNSNSISHTGGDAANLLVTSVPNPEVGKTYLVKFTANNLSGFTSFFLFGGTGLSAEARRIAGPGDYSFVVTATSNQGFVLAPYEGPAFDVTFTNLSVKELTGLAAATMFQDAIGVTAASSVEQPAGVILDKRLAVLRGADVVNGGFDTDTAWAKTNATISGGRVNFIGNGDVRQTHAETLAVGDWVEVSFQLVSRAGGFVGPIVAGVFLTDGFYTNEVGLTKKFIYKITSITDQSVGLYTAFGADQIVADNFSIRKINGNHARQATSAARPVLSARKNYYQSTDDVRGSAWNKFGSTATSATMVTGDGTGGQKGVQQYSTSLFVEGQVREFSAIFAAGTAPCVQFYIIAGDNPTNVPAHQVFDLVNGVLGASSGTALSNVSITSIGGGEYRCKATYTITNGSATVYVMAADNANVGGYAGAAAGSSFSMRQASFGDPGSSYQAVTSHGSYSTAGHLHYLKFDGIDDSLTAGTFAAGTLTNNMDCFMLYRRDGNGNAIMASNSVSGSPYFGYIHPTDGNPCALGVGTFTVAVNGVVLAGGGIPTSTQLQNALPKNQWCVVEFRNLDLSAWTSLMVSAATSYANNAGIGDIVAAPAQTVAKRTQLRQYLATKAGITLP